jgi:hypothetical protein
LLLAKFGSKLVLHTSLDWVMLMHGFFTTFGLMTASGFVGLLVFSNEQRKGSIDALKVLALLTTIFVFSLDISGAYGYVWYRLPDPQSPKSVILATTPAAHEVLFETMEYLGLAGPVWASLITWLTWHYKDKIFTNIALKNIMLVLITVAVLYTIVIAYTGVVPTRIAAVR